jgi:hypothetical protein
MKKKIAILQSNYIPWIGYFDIINTVDVFVIYDSVQYTKNDWRNRNRIKTANGPTWLTIPITTSKSSTQRISEAKIANSLWTKKHWKSIESSMAKSPFFDMFREDWLSWYQAANEFGHLHDVNILFLKGVCGQLGINTEIICDTDLTYSGYTPSDKLVSICEALNAESYLTGPAGLNYLDLDVFANKGIDIEVMDYGYYKPYEQPHGEFIQNVSALDLLVNVGLGSRKFLVGRTIKI